MYIAFKKKPKRSGVPIRILLLLLTTVILSFSTNNVEKKFKYEDTLTGFQKGMKWIDIVKGAIDRSDLPAKDVTMIKDSLTEFQNKIILQVNSQLEADKKLNEKPPSKTDTTQKKTN